MEGVLTFHSDCFNDVVSAIKMLHLLLTCSMKSLTRMIPWEMISRDNKSFFFSQWAGPVEDLGEEFDKIDENGGGQVVTIIALLAPQVL